ncbi:MAG: dTDP-4-dehydrorhamnose reductase [Bacteroidota bacterium]|nr:dTDP-4-dehydrorhamnose reductase [Bacteroidota bacterium]
MGKNHQLYNPEIWGGLECTINRVGDEFRDQLQYAGHYKRKDDIDHFAELGISSLRYPVLWEAHQPVSEDQSIDWNYTQQQLEKIRLHKITPIVGLIHHGSGPEFTDLLNENFPEQLAGYAYKVAKQFPWVEYYTPVNEPLTTARFSGLYGTWFPHHKDDLSFAKMLLNQLKAIVLSMQQIRKINPQAKLVQTEDLAKIHSTSLLSYQANFENERRWLTYDILCARLNPEHIFWNYFIQLGVKKTELQFFLDHPCPPDIAGFNYYITSERFLDQKIQLYPTFSYGTNGKHFYADVAAARIKKPLGLKKLLKEAWQRYQLPIVLTEVHMNCTREEQLRWFKEAWDSCCDLRKENINIKAITAWSLLGAYDWDSLLTLKKNHYEIGVFDITKKVLRPTAMAKLIQSLAKTGTYQHPVINEKGWWHRSYPNHKNIFRNSKNYPLLIFGCNGTLGSAFIRVCKRRAITYRAFSHQELDVTKKDQVEKIISEMRPWAIVNAAGYVRVDDAESDKEMCFRLNAEAPGLLAEVCKKYGLQLMTFSSDLVFDGKKQSPYVELDYVKPLNIYGHSKAKGELLVLNNNHSSLIIRTSAFFGPWDDFNFASQILKSLQKKNSCTVVKDVIISPTYVPDLVDKALDLLIDEEKGIWHLTNDGMVTWYDFAEEVALRAGFKKENIVSCSQQEMNWKAKRPEYSALQSSKGIKLPSLEHAIGRFFEEKLS